MPQESAPANGEAPDAASSSQGETLSVTVTELADANTFYVQVKLSLYCHCTDLACKEVALNPHAGPQGHF